MEGAGGEMHVGRLSLMGSASWTEVRGLHEGENRPDHTRGTETVYLRGMRGVYDAFLMLSRHDPGGTRYYPSGSPEISSQGGREGASNGNGQRI
jgi:hypothetical protein